MGNCAENVKLPFIQPTPGSYGCGVKKKGCIIIYTEQEVFTYRYNPQLLISDIKHSLQENLGLLFKLYRNDVELDDSLTLSDAEVPEGSMVKAVLYSIHSSSSTKSLSSENTQKSSDLSKYSVPDVGRLNFHMI